MMKWTRFLIQACAFAIATGLDIGIVILLYKHYKVQMKIVSIVAVLLLVFFWIGWFGGLILNGTF